MHLNFLKSILGITVVLLHYFPASHADDHIGIGVSSDSYVSPRTGNPTLNTIEGSLDKKFQSGMIELGVEAGAEINVNRPAYNFVHPYELYAATKVGKFGKIAAGRKKLNWSTLDSKWELGIWQPRFRWDFVRPEEAGLTGIFYEMERESVQVSAVFSPIFVPELGPGFELENGVFSSPSPWFASPPTTYDFNTGKIAAVYYSLERPEITDVLNHMGAGASVRVGKKRGFWGKTGFAYKPINQLIIGYQGTLTSDRMDVVVFPRILYHRLWTGEIGFKSKQVATTVSYLREDPIRDRTPSEWTTQELKRSETVGLNVDWTLMGEDNHSTVLSLGYIRQWGGFLPDQGPISQFYTGSFFEDRYPFKNAVDLGLRGAFPGQLGEIAQFWVRQRYDLKSTARIVSLGVLGKPHPRWAVSLGFDILGIDHESPAGSAYSSGFVSQFRGNDRFKLGVSYVF